MSRILLIGASGLLGSELLKLNPDIVAPPHSEFDIRFNRELQFEYDIVINCAAVKDNRKIEQDPTLAIETNIIGAAWIARQCAALNIRYVYISTDYLYEGSRGNYSETDPIKPFNLYAFTKLGGECSAVCVKNHLIIRTSFGPSKFEYHQAFSDKWTSKDYVDRIAPMILEAALSPITGFLNIGTERKTMYSHASERSQVEAVNLSESSHRTPYDTSLNLQKWMDFKAAHPVAKPHTNCRICGSSNMTKYLDLGLMPLANNLEITSLRAKDKDKFPLQVMFCEDCGLSQLSVVIDPGKMFSYYTYRSSVNGGYVKHARQMAKDLREKYLLNETSSMIDIAGNDGALLREFKDEIGLEVLNVDPATNLAAIAEASGIPTIADFWSLKVAESVYHKADLITATNVFAHVDNVREFLQAAKEALKESGVLVIECPYLIDFIENFEFDTIYFEHLSYMSVLPLNRLCGDLGLKIINVEKQAIHGGTIRITIAKDESMFPVEQSVMDFAEHELKGGFQNIDRYKKWSGDVKAIISDFGSQLLSLKKQGCRIAGIGASAKGNTLLNSAGINTDIMDYICDDTPEKIGKYSPGTGIPIVYSQELIKNPPDYLVILSWNFTEALINRAKSVGYKGKFIVGVPEFTILEN